MRRAAFQCVILVAALALFLYFTFFDVWVVPESAMRVAAANGVPIAAGDWLLVKRDSNAAAGELVRCEHPNETGHVVGRLIARAGDRVIWTKEGAARVLRGSVPLAATVVVDPKRAYLASDDRKGHLDSRDFGSPLSRTCQAIVLRVWSSELGLSGLGAIH